jgi:hypothetical protein
MSGILLSAKSDRLRKMKCICYPVLLINMERDGEKPSLHIGREN